MRGRACIWSRVNCPISASFPRWIVLFTARCVHFLPPKVNCATYSPQLVYVCVCVCLHGILGQLPNFGKFFPVNLQFAVCIYASQSELRHLQCVRAYCMCVCVSHICFKYIAALILKMAAPPAVALVQNLVRIQGKRKQSLFTKNSDVIWGCAIYRRYLFLFFAPSTFPPV